MYVVSDSRLNGALSVMSATCTDPVFVDDFASEFVLDAFELGMLIVPANYNPAQVRCSSALSPGFRCLEDTRS